MYVISSKADIEDVCSLVCVSTYVIDASRPKHDGHHYADDIFECIFVSANVSISIKISLKFVPKRPIATSQQCSGNVLVSKNDKPLP